MDHIDKPMPQALITIAPSNPTRMFFNQEAFFIVEVGSIGRVKAVRFRGSVLLFVDKFTIQS